MPIRRGGVTLQQIADHVGVSKATVSYLLSGGKSNVRISDATRKKVEEAARTLGYRPNAVARALARRRTDIITLVMPFPAVFSGHSAFMGSMLSSLVDAARANGFDVMLHIKEAESLEAEIAILVDGRADGALVLRDANDPLIMRLQEEGLPCIFFLALPHFPEVASVTCDDAEGGRLAGQYLLSLGHRQIGFVGGIEDSAASQQRHLGLQQALQGTSTPLAPENTFIVPFRDAPLDMVLTRMARPDRPSALFVWSDDVAIKLMGQLRQRLGLRIPEDLSVVGFDDSLVAENSVPPLTTIHQPIDSIVQHAVKRLATRIRGESDPAGPVFFSPYLVIRDSCAPYTG